MRMTEVNVIPIEVRTPQQLCCCYFYLAKQFNAWSSGGGSGCAENKGDGSVIRAMEGDKVSKARQ